MGLFGKLKNIFYDEEIVEVPETKTKEVKKEEKPRIEEVHIQKREESKIVEEPVKPNYSERELFKTENTFKFPILDDEDEEPIKTRSRVNALELERNKKNEVKESKLDRYDRSNDRFNNSNKREIERPKEPERVFKPSPIISPVYGILDDNYTKEELKERQKKYETPIVHKTSEMNYDSVRRKAYGTLEDELDHTLSNLNTKHEEINNEIKEVEKIVEDKNSKSIEDLLNEIEGNRNVSIGEIEELIKDKIEEDEDKDEIKTFVQKSIEQTEPKEEERNKEDLGDKTLEHDLFNLIDSMYEEKEGE